MVEPGTEQGGTRNRPIEVSDSEFQFGDIASRVWNAFQHPRTTDDRLDSQSDVILCSYCQFQTFGVVGYDR